MLLWISVALAAPGSSDGCIPDGSALYPTVEAPLDPARVQALVGPTLAGLVATYAPHTYTPNGWWNHWVEPFKGPALPAEVRLPVWAPAPLTATVTLQEGAPQCVSLRLSAWNDGNSRPAPTWDDGRASIEAPIPGRVDVAWHGRTVATMPLTGVDEWSVVWNTAGALLLPGNIGCGPYRLTGAPDERGFDFQCLPDAWLATLAKGTWSRSERAAIVALLADRSFDGMPIEAQAALVARTDLTREDKLAIGVPERKSEGGVATIRGKGLRVAIDGVEAKNWVDGPDGRSVKVPARGLAKVTVERLDDPNGHWTWDMWVGDGTDMDVSMFWGPVLRGPPGTGAARWWATGSGCARRGT